MLKTLDVTPPGADRPTRLTELPALVADAHARRALAAAGLPLDGGVIALTFTHLSAVMALGDASVDLLAPFVQADRAPRSWRAALALQQSALMLHAGFLIGRPRIDIPVTMQAEAALAGGPDVAVHFCSPTLATVLDSGRATYRELETVLSTEDAYNLAELANVSAIRAWHAHQSTKSSRP